MRNIQNQRGFTLIELIIVIVILGILAVTAAPKFIDIQGDARGATLEGVKAALQGGAQLVYAKSAIAGEQGNPKTVTTAADRQILANNLTIGTHYGYPDSATITAIKSATPVGTDVAAFAELDAADWDFIAGTGASAVTASPALGYFGISPDGATVDYTKTAEDGASCHVLYKDAGGVNTPPVITVVKGGC
ncbi:prepilin-type N-terminal cleavage/methylation domain-containing protein [Paraglaciecola algarum]|uniref:prepilin-type N-terminal cleavage/methylation domain-containing protein n=1 Tax=Paraglaciecola algarum TaxID=3050085 RepID=UPI0024E0E145|nr:prepilin-type N-terminal cleavage/methylation domain-containing protein [Paraglaciecola sp. G1-23]